MSTQAKIDLDTIRRAHADHDAELLTSLYAYFTTDFRLLSSGERLIWVKFCLSQVKITSCRDFRDHAGTGGMALSSATLSKANARLPALVQLMPRSF